MVFEHIEKLKQEYTDKYVIVDDQLPELRRFKGLTGTVKTVNMNGQALVQFDGNNNIGWFDIGIDYLKVIDQPLPKPEVKLARGSAKSKAETKAETKAEAKAEIKAEAQAKPATAAEPSGGKGSVADILAAARSGAGPAKPAKKKPASDEKKAAGVDDILAAARGQGAAAKAAPVAKPDKPKAPARPQAEDMDVADILAAARGKAAPPAAEKQAAPPAAKKSTDPSQLSVADILAAARGKGATAKSPEGAGPAADIPAPRGLKDQSDPKQLGVAEILAAARKPKSEAGGDSVSEALEAGRAQKESPPASAPPAAKSGKDPQSMSVADILAAARGKTGGPTAAVKSVKKDKEAASNSAPTAAPTEPPEKPSPPTSPAAAKDSSLPTDVADIVAFCRRVDKH